MQSSTLQWTDPRKGAATTSAQITKQAIKFAADIAIKRVIPVKLHAAPTKPSIVHFAKANLPPAKFFWSMTMYTTPDRFLYANSLDRYSIGDRTKGLVYGKDGSLTIYVSNTSPGKDKESNWLPAPAATCSLVARVYGPSKAAMTGKWKLPPLLPQAAASDVR